MKLKQVFSHKKNEEEQQIEIIKNSEFFDAKWYLEQNPDIKKRKMSAARHYLKKGWQENRDPSPKFNTKKYLREHQECKVCPLVFEHNRNGYVDLSICAIMKNEGPYVKEWIDYHRLVGVKRFYIYDNESTDDIYLILLPYIQKGIVVYKYYPGEARQVPAYNECLKEYREKTKWLAFIDADEFIVPVEKDTIPEFLKDYEEFPGVEINWVHYDSNGYVKKPRGSVLESYVRRQYEIQSLKNHRGKSIIQPLQSERMHAHVAYYLDGKSAVTENKKETNDFADVVSVNKIRINHYYCKSKEEAEAKINKGDAMGKTRSVSLNDLNFSQYIYDYIMFKYLMALNPDKSYKYKYRKVMCDIKNIFIRLKYALSRNTLKKLIDEQWYFNQYPEAKDSKLSAMEHYLTIGWKLGYNPSPLFDTNFYRERYQDIKKTNYCPLLHYVTYGKNENRLPKAPQKMSKSVADDKTKISPDYEMICNSGLFDKKWYSKQYLKNQKDIDPVEHYLTIGWKEGNNPSKKFDTKFYLEQYKDIAKAGVCPLSHYIYHGKAENRLPLSLVKPGKEIKLNKQEEDSLVKGVKIYLKTQNKIITHTLQKFKERLKKLFCKKIKKYSVNTKYVANPTLFTPAESYFSDRELKAKKYEKAVFLPIKQRATDKLFMGGVIDKNGNYVEESSLPEMKYHDYQCDKDEIIYVDEDVVYIGCFWIHYGHFILELVSRLWFVVSKKNNSRIKIAYNFIENMPLPQYMLDCFHLLGIKDSQLYKVTQPTCFKSIIVPELSAISGQYFTSQYKEIYDKIRDVVSATKNDKIYLSRTHFKKARETEYGEWYIEKLFADNGYKVIYPEELSFVEQISIMKGAKEVACLSGTPAHQTLFAEDGTKLIVINKQSRVLKNQFVVTELRKLQITYIDAYAEMPYVDTGRGPFLLAKTPFLQSFIKDRKFKDIEFDTKQFRKDVNSYIKRYSQFAENKNLSKTVTPEILETEIDLFKQRYVEKDNLIVDALKDIFDEQWYVSQYPEVKNSGLTALAHYAKEGWKKGYNPSPLFDTKFYLEKYKDVAKVGVCPLLHYIFHGKDEGRLTLPQTDLAQKTQSEKQKEDSIFKGFKIWCKVQKKLAKNTWKKFSKRIKNIFSKKKPQENPLKDNVQYFDEKWYLNQYPEVKDSGLSPRKHYDTIGWKKGYNPNTEFDTVWYLTKYKDIAKANINPLLHYMNSGKKEGRRPLPEKKDSRKNLYKKLLSYYFDHKWYCDKYLDDKKDFIQALEHYDTIGWKKGYNPSTHFDTRYYLKQCPYLAKFDISPLQHFLEYGFCCRCMPNNLNYDYYKRLSDNEYREALEEWYRYVTTKELNLDNPKTFNEKVQWLKLYASTPIKTLLADKYLVRDWVKEKIGERYLIPLLGVYDSFDEIDFDKLPNQFVMKGNHGCAFNIIVKDKSKLDIADARNKLSNWLKLNFAYMGGMELQYKNMSPKIVVEKFIENKKSDDLNDYKFFCFDGKVKYVQVISERINGTHKVSFYDTNWKKQNWWDNDFYEGEVEKPKKFDEMVKLADKLCKGFNFVRVDLYYLDTDDIYFGEMTFTPASGVMRWSSNDINLKLGNMIKLPKYAYDVNSGKYYKPKKHWYLSLLDYFKKDELDYVVKNKQYNNIIWNDECYFDEEYYVFRHPGVNGYKGSAKSHYQAEGWKKGYNPSVEFDTNEYLRQYPECKICPLDFEYNRNGYVDLSIVAIMRNEGSYVKEWIDYHRLVGVKRFYIYDNESTDNLQEVLTPYIEQGIVVYKYFPGRKEDGMQTKAYTECINDYKDKTEWLAIIDADEFIVPMKKKSIPNFLKDYKEYPGVVVNWVVYDSNGHTDKPEGGVLENYARIHFSHNCNDDRMIKSIVNPRKVKYPEGHCSIYNNNECAVTENFTRHPHMNSTIFHSGNKIRINHYWTKSKSEYLAKIKKPRCNGIYLQETENHYNFKDFKYDYTVWKFVAKLDKKFLKEFFKYVRYSVKSFLIGMKHPPVPDINDYVDEKYYQFHYPEYKNEAKSALIHYMSIGWKKGYNPSEKFDTKYYLNRYHDIAKAGVNPLLHYISSGYKEGRMPKLGKSSIWSNLLGLGDFSKNELYSKIYASKLFNRGWYLRHYPEVSKQHIEPLEHYLTVGWKKGYNPSEKFDTNFYLNTYPDIKQAKMNPLLHYLDYGKAEGRNIAEVLECKDSIIRIIYRKLFVKKLDNPKISIIVASYNYEQYIGETLDSLMAQTYRNFEVIVVDDGSKDTSIDIINKYVKKYSNVFLFTHENRKNKGLVETIKLGISKVCGEYIAFCESDDKWAANHLEEKVKLINKYFNPEIIANDVELLGKKDADYEKYLDNNIRTLVGERINVNVTMQKYNIIPTFSCVMIRKDILVKSDFDSFIPAWTDWWIYRQILSTAPLYYIPQKLTFWRLHDSYNSSEKSAEYMNKYNEFMVYSNTIIAKQNKNYNSILENNENCRLTKSSNLFDEKWYLKQYKEVRDMNISALYHYNMLGWKLGYNPSLKFDTEAYLNLYPDLKTLEISPLVHYIKYGKKEGRSCISCIHKPLFYKTECTISQRYKGNILLVSHMLNHTGAPILLKQVAELLNKKRYKVTVLSPKDGDLRDEILQVGADVIIDANAFAKEQDCEYLKEYNFAFCICNTYINALIYSYLSKFIPSILWIHDNLNEKSANVIMPVLSTSKDIYAASKLTKSYMDPYNKNIKILTYPAKDVVRQIKKSNGKPHKARIAVCAALQPRKGQDIFIEAIKMLPENVRQNAEFLLLGEESTVGYKNKLKGMGKDIPEIKFVEAIKNNTEYHKFIDELDVLCCPSREDPCPLVVLDAFMHGVPAIVSDHVGQKDIINNKRDGYIFSNENVNELSQILNHLIVTKEYLLLKNKSRAIFNRNFSDKKFLNDLFKIMEEKCKK